MSVAPERGNVLRMRIEGKVVLITGASEGIGAACVNAFRRRGARIALTARSKKKLDSNTGPDDLAVAADLTVADDRREIVKRTLDHFGRIDILVNNAGIGLYAPSWKAPMETTRQMFELNLFAPVEMTQLVVPGMRAQRSGTIVNVGSIAGKITLPWLTLYSASKHAIGSFTDGLRMELKQDGIHAMTVCPGYVNTGFQSHVLEGTAPASLQNSRRFAITADECAKAIVKGVERDARTVMTPWIGWLLIAAQRLFPAMIDARFERIHQHAQ